jgi:hypothetical protein
MTTGHKDDISIRDILKDQKQLWRSHVNGLGTLTAYEEKKDPTCYASGSSVIYLDHLNGGWTMFIEHKSSKE